MGSVTFGRSFSRRRGRIACGRRAGRGREVVLHWLEAQENGTAPVFVADRRHRPVQIAEPAPVIHEIVFVPLEASKRDRHIEAGALVGDRDEGALAGQHELHGNGLGGISSVAVLERIAQRVPQRYEQVPDQLQPRRRREPFQERGLQKREKIVPPAATNAHADVSGCNARVGNIAQRFALGIRCLDLREEPCPGVAQVDHAFA